MLHLPTILLLLPAVLGSELFPREKSLCSQVTEHCLQSGQQARVTAYCSSYLDIAASTTTSTTYTATVTAALTCGKSLRQDKRSDAQQGQHLQPALQRRALTKPKCLKADKGTQISAACACLSLSTPPVVSTTVSSARSVTAPFQVEVTGSYFQPQDDGYVDFGSNAETYRIDGDGHIFDSAGKQGAVSNINHSPGSWVSIRDSSTITGNFYPLVCSIGDKDCALTCSAGILNYTLSNFGDWYLAGPGDTSSGGTPITPIVVASS